jgi:predicted metal-dependent HD superfamily phosphohydrolase
MTDLTDWLRTWRGLGVEESSYVRNLYAEVLARYAEPHRHYHTQQHLKECFQQLPEIARLAEHPSEVDLALWFHDAIYDTHATDNEKRSADWALDVCRNLNVNSESAERISKLIMFTRHAVEPIGSDAEVLVDIDLSILSAAPERFAEYETQVRAEYSWVPEELFREKRSDILREFLQRPHIYSTPVFRERYETRARANLERSIELLRA